MEDTKIPAESATVPSVEPVPEPRPPRFAWLRRLFRRDDAEALPAEVATPAVEEEPVDAEPSPDEFVTRAEVHALIAGALGFVREQEVEKRLEQEQRGEASRAILVEMLAEHAESARLRSNGRRRAFPKPASRLP